MTSFFKFVFFLVLLLLVFLCVGALATEFLFVVSNAVVFLVLSSTTFFTSLFLELAFVTFFEVTLEILLF